MNVWAQIEPTIYMQAVEELGDILGALYAEAEQFFKIEHRGEGNLIGVAHQLPIAALHVGGRFGDITDANVNPFVEPRATDSIPIKTEIVALWLWRARSRRSDRHKRHRCESTCRFESHLDPPLAFPSNALAPHGMR